VVWLRVLSRTNLAYRSHDSITTFRINTCKSVSKQRTLTLFRINTYKKTGGGGTPTFSRERQSPDWHSLPPSYAPRSSSIPCGLNRLRILPVTAGVYPRRASVFSVPSVKGSGGSSFGEAQKGGAAKTPATVGGEGLGVTKLPGDAATAPAMWEFFSAP